MGGCISLSQSSLSGKEYYRDLILKSIREHSSLTRSDIDELLWKKLPDWMNDKQCKIKINNLLSELRKNNRIRNNGTLKDPIWILKKTSI
jgi:ATP-dependent DNA helicase RecG